MESKRRRQKGTRYYRLPYPSRGDNMGGTGCAFFGVVFFAMYILLIPLWKLQTWEGIPTNNAGVGLATIACLLLPIVDLIVIWTVGIKDNPARGVQGTLAFYGRLLGVMALLLVANFIVVQLLLLVP